MDVRPVPRSMPPQIARWEHDGAPAIAVSNNLPHGLPTLTPRERDVLLLLVHRQTDREIAARLGIGRRTVETHVSRILAKLAVPNRRAAAVVALAHGSLVESG
jgi:DNA-binding CsgD family transcriptional regulator